MSHASLTASERLRLRRRALEELHRRSLQRRTDAGFRRSLAIVPHVFLGPDLAVAVWLVAPADAIQSALQGRAVWTLDTAARLACGRGFVRTGDLHGYVSRETLAEIETSGAVVSASDLVLSADPVAARPPVLLVNVGPQPEALVLSSGHRVVTWKRLLRDILGTFGWRGDLIARVEGAYPGSAVP